MSSRGKVCEDGKIFKFINVIPDPAPPPTEELCNAFNELRSDMVLLCELRSALGTCVFELESLKHQFEALCPGKVNIKIKNEILDESKVTASILFRLSAFP